MKKRDRTPELLTTIALFAIAILVTHPSYIHEGFKGYAAALALFGLVCWGLNKL